MLLTALPLAVSTLAVLSSIFADALPLEAYGDWRSIPVPAPNQNSATRGRAGVTRVRSSRTQQQRRRDFVANPKVVLNPKNPYYSSSVAALMDPTTSSSSSSSSAAPTTDAVLPPTTIEWATTTTTSAASSASSTTSPDSTTVPVVPSSSAVVLPPATTQRTSTSSESTQSIAPTTTATTTEAPTTRSTTTTTPTTTTTTTTTTTSASPAPTSPAPHIYTGGIATFFYQGGNAGNCGWYESDSTLLVALPTATYANGKYCGQYVHITRLDTGDSIKALVADSCPSCVNDNCLDLSWGAFSALGGTEDMGIFDISWYFLPSS